jgi:hypothetical protein
MSKAQKLSIEHTQISKFSVDNRQNGINDVYRDDKLPHRYNL